MTPDMLKTLSLSQDTIRKILPQQLDYFYAHIARWPEVNAFFKTDAIREHARTEQGKHWSRIASGEINEEYYRSSIRIGKTHNRIGLEPKWYLGGYAVLTAQIVRAVMDEMMSGAFVSAKRKNQTEDLLDALIRAIFLDMELAVSTYLQTKDKDFKDFLGDLSNTFDAEMAGFIKDLGSASSNMMDNAQSLGGISQTGLSQAMAMSEAAAQAAHSAQTVSSATEELSVSTAEINSQIAKTATIVQDASQKSQHASQSMNHLKDSADKIDSVIQLITAIAGQTNLLALNATIEAARAGDAGKGFAVVAGEVKSLATQSQSASEEIRDLVQSIQDSVNGAVDVIEDVAKTIAQVEEIAQFVSTTVEQQSLATHEIVQSASVAAQGAKDLSHIAENVTENNEQGSKISESVSIAARDMEEKTKRLREQLDVFLAGIRK